jgi:uncharacterized protein (DUF2384 family)
MRAQDTPLIRRQFLVSTNNIKKLADLSSREGCSAAEIVRRAIDAYDLSATHEDELEAMLSMVQESLQQAIISTQEANRKVEDALHRLEHNSGHK